MCYFQPIVKFKFRTRLLHLVDSSDTPNKTARDVSKSFLFRRSLSGRREDFSWMSFSANACCGTARLRIATFAPLPASPDLKSYVWNEPMHLKQGDVTLNCSRKVRRIFHCRQRHLFFRQFDACVEVCRLGEIFGAQHADIKFQGVMKK